MKHGSSVNHNKKSHLSVTIRIFHCSSSENWVERPNIFLRHFIIKIVEKSLLKSYRRLWLTNIWIPIPNPKTKKKCRTDQYTWIHSYMLLYKFSGGRWLFNMRRKTFIEKTWAGSWIRCEHGSGTCGVAAPFPVPVASLRPALYIRIAVEKNIQPTRPEKYVIFLQTFTPQI